ncbi:MAG: YHS domain-containing protein [Dissulfurispiraceae bacterium]|jgi:YHS domain-containing protein
MKMRRVFLIVSPFFVFAVLALACLSAEAAQSENGSKSEIMGTGDSSPAVKAEPAGNEICPVSGEKIDPKESVTYEYKGKVYNFCCQGCVEQFKKDPEMYIRKMEKEKAGTGVSEPPEHADHN